MNPFNDEKHIKKVLSLFKKVKTDQLRLSLTGILCEQLPDDSFRFTKTDGHILISFNTYNSVLFDYLSKHYYKYESNLHNSDNESVIFFEKPQSDNGPYSYPNYYGILPRYQFNYDAEPNKEFNPDLSLLCLNFYRLFNEDKNLQFMPFNLSQSPSSKISGCAHGNKDFVILQMPLRFRNIYDVDNEYFDSYLPNEYDFNNTNNFFFKSSEKLQDIGKSRNNILKRYNEFIEAEAKQKAEAE